MSTLETSTLLHREEVKALIRIKSPLLEFRAKLTGVTWTKWVNWLPAWKGDIDRSLDHYDFRIAPSSEKSVSKCEHNPNGYCADCWPLFKEPVSKCKCLEKINGLMDIQGKQGTADYNEYMRGMYNGMEVIRASLTGCEGVFREPSLEKAQEAMSDFLTGIGKEPGKPTFQCSVCGKLYPDTLPAYYRCSCGASGHWRLAPEWREFTLTDERIQLGDQECHKEGKQVWYMAGGLSVGPRASEHPNYRFRTRRPLPVQEETQTCPVCKGSGEYCAAHSSGGAMMSPCFNPQCTAPKKQEKESRGLSYAPESQEENTKEGTTKEVAPVCPKCGNNRQVWRDRRMGWGNWKCHRAGCGHFVGDFSSVPSSWLQKLHASPEVLPLEKKKPLDVIEKSALEMISHGSVFACLRYLRDEIESLNRRVGGSR